MSYVSRTHRVDYDWLYDRINLDPMIQILYVNTTKQLADILTKLIIHRRQRDTTDTIGEHHLCSCEPDVSSMSTRESLATSACAKQKPVHCSGLIARIITEKNADMYCTQYCHQNTEWEVTPSVKTCVCKIPKESPGRRQKHQAPGDRLPLKVRRQNTGERKVHVCKVCAQCTCTVSGDNLFPTTNELKGKAYHKD